MAKGGARPGAGRPPTNLRATVTTRANPDGTVTEVSVIDRVEETIRQGAFVKDAAARVGVSVETLRRWQANGVRLRREMAERGGRNRSDLSHHERDCVELADRMDAAEADARTTLLVLGQKLARGGYTRTEVSEKVDASGNVLERTTRTTTADADFRAIQWLLSHRWPADFGTTKVEVTGADGGPVQIEAAPVADRLREVLAEARRNAEAGNRDAIEAQLAAASAPTVGTNGHSPNGHGNGDHPRPT